VLALRHFTPFLAICIATIVSGVAGTAHAQQEITSPALIIVTVGSPVVDIHIASATIIVTVHVTNGPMI
jgi:hypothetical protein